MALIKRYKSKIYGNYWLGILKFGFLIGFGLSFILIFRRWLDDPINQPVGFIENFAMLGLIFISVYLYKLGLAERRITFKESYIVGFGSGVFGSVIYGMSLYGYALYLDHGLQNRCFDVQRAIESNSHLSNADIMYMTTPQSIALSGIMLSSIMAILWAMVVGVLLRNEKGEIISKDKKFKI
ncbi:MAG TPA: DUF4199 domain-containing protein [Bacteroidales bacterium]|nr:DUF4199 domain-containing protein [Bacteroidales bacterium]